MNQISKFELKPTVNEPKKWIVLKLRILEKGHRHQQPSYSPSDHPTLLDYEK